jgi:hypothetical protein
MTALKRARNKSCFDSRFSFPGKSSSQISADSGSGCSVTRYRAAFPASLPPASRPARRRDRQDHGKKGDGIGSRGQQTPGKLSKSVRGLFAASLDSAHKGSRVDIVSGGVMLCHHGRNVGMGTVLAESDGEDGIGQVLGHGARCLRLSWRANPSYFNPKRGGLVQAIPPLQKRQLHLPG